MKVILSRKGFDSASGGTPSPILPDGRIVSLPIPDKSSPVRYQDIDCQGLNLGILVNDLTRGRLRPDFFAHLDPDINSESLPRLAGWRTIFGQTGAAQGHLRNMGVAPGDIFLFYGLFQNVNLDGNRYSWDKTSLPRHVMWGWLQIDEIIRIDECDRSKLSWAQNHPHFHRSSEKNNTIYLGSSCLKISGVNNQEIPGAGVFRTFSDHLQLTEPGSTSLCNWRMPEWCFPKNGKVPLSYHPRLADWMMGEGYARLKAASRGQEFVMDCEEYPQANGWIENIILRHESFHEQN